MPYTMPRTKAEHYFAPMDGRYQPHAQPGDVTRIAVNLLRSTHGEFLRLSPYDRVRRHAILLRWHTYGQQCRKALLGTGPEPNPHTYFSPRQEQADLLVARRLCAQVNYLPTEHAPRYR
jgi:hypothetical protein